MTRYEYGIKLLRLEKAGMKMLFRVKFEVERGW